MKKCLATICLLFLFLVDCVNPFLKMEKKQEKNETENLSKTGSVKITFSTTPIDKNLSRTIVADFTEQITKWKVTITKEGIEKSTNSTSGSVTFNDVEVGTWSVTVEGRNSSDLIIANGVSTVTIVEGTTSTCNITTDFRQTAGRTGGFLLTLNFPASSGINFVSGEIDGGALFTATIDTSNATTHKAVFSKNGITSGGHEIIFTFRKGGATGEIAGVFREAINIWDNAVSDKFLGVDGNGKVTFNSVRNYTEDDFFDKNANLSAITISNCILDSAFVFSDETYEATITADAITINPVQSIAGQSIKYNWNGAATDSDISSGTVSTSLPVNNTGTNILLIKVTSPDRQNSKTYTFNCVRKYRVIYDANVSTGGAPPIDSNYYPNGATIAILGNTGNLQKTASSFINWNTSSNGTGTQYCQYETLTIVSSDLTLYAFYLPVELYITGSNGFNNAVVWDRGSVSEKNNANYKKVFASGNDIYVAGSEWNSINSYWDGVYYKNGVELTRVSASNKSNYLNSIFFVNNNVYLCGNDGNNEGFIKEGVSTSLLGANQIPVDIISDGIKKFSCGWGTYANFWLDSTPENLDSNSGSKAYSLTNRGDDILFTFTSGGKIFFCEAKYNLGTSYTYTYTVKDTTFTGVGTAITTKGNNIYIAGYDGTNAFYLISTNGGINFSKTTLSGGAVATGLSFVNDKLYIIGRSLFNENISSTSLLWVEGGESTPYKLWNTKESGYANPTSISAKNYYITFDKNDPDATGTMGTQTIQYKVQKNLFGNKFTKTNYRFIGWATTPSGSVVYSDKSQYYLNSFTNVTLYAKWDLTGGVSASGGIIFYENPNPNWATEDGWRYLECSPKMNEATKMWDKGTYGVTGATDPSISKGKVNTLKINLIRGTEGEAANYCSTLSYTPPSFNDWFLPSMNELNAVYTNLKSKNIGDFVSSTYWSSTESNLSGAYDTVFSNGTNLTPTKNSPFYVRPIRAFRSLTDNKPLYIVLYHKNGATGGTAPTDSYYYQSGENATVKGTSDLINTSYPYFAGWNTQADGNGTNYSENQQFTVTGNTTLYAKWVQRIYVNASVSGPGAGTPSDPYKSLDTAITNVSAGFEILVATGTYNISSPITIDKDIALKGGYNSSDWSRYDYQTESDRSANQTIIIYTGTGVGTSYQDIIAPIIFDTGATLGCVIEGFTIKGITNSTVVAPGAIRLNGSSAPTIRYNTIYGGGASGGAVCQTSVGISSCTSGSPLIVNNSIDGGTGPTIAGWGSNGIYIVNSGSPVVKYNRLVLSTTSNSYGNSQGVSTDGIGRPIVSNNFIKSYFGIHAGSSIEVYNNVIVAVYYGVIIADKTNGNSAIINNTIIGLLSGSSGIHSYGSSSSANNDCPIIINNIITNFANGIFVISATYLGVPYEFKNNNIFGCTYLYNYQGTTYSTASDLNNTVIVGSGGKSGNISESLTIDSLTGIITSCPTTVSQGGLFEPAGYLTDFPKNGSSQYTDKDGTLNRSSNGTWSIGAFEY